MSKKLCIRNDTIEGLHPDDRTKGDIMSEYCQTQFHRVDLHESGINKRDDSSGSGVKSLMDHCIAYIASNAHFVESFSGFPDIIGEKIFKTALKHGTFTNENSKLTSALQPFCEAYGRTVLETLSLSGQYLVLNNYLESIFMFTEVTKLDISHCGLGDSHEMLHHISQLQSLETLIMRGNALTDEGLRKLTAPIRMFQKGLKVLRYLDLSDNQLTARGVKYLMCFTGTQIINLSANKIQNYNILKVNGFHISMTASDLCNDIFFMETKGWAAPLFGTWCQEWAVKSEAKKVRKSTFYAKPHDPVCHQSPVTSDHPIYSLVLVSDNYQPQTAQKDSKHLNKFLTNRNLMLPCKSEKGTDSKSSKLNCKNVRHLSSVKLDCVDASHIEVSKILDQSDEDLLKMYSGYSKTGHKTSTLSGVLSQSW